MIAAQSPTALQVREALATAVDAENSQPRIGARRQAETLGQPPLDNAFLDRCRLALSGLVGLNDSGVIQISSARRGEGRSTVAAAVATVLARTRGRTGVLLLDLDFSRASQADLFAVAPAPGLADYLEGREKLLRLVAGLERQLWLTPAGNHLGDPLRVIHILSVDRLLEVFRESFQWVVLDLPPLLDNPEVTLLAREADWHILVGRHRRTSLGALRKVHELLDTDRPAGFLLTSDSNRIPGWIRRRL